MYARNRSLCETRDQCLLFHHHAPTGNVSGTLSAKAAVWAVEGIAAFLRSGFPGRTKHSTNRAALGRGQSRSRQAARRAGPLAALPQAGWQSRLRRRALARAAGPAAGHSAPSLPTAFRGPICALGRLISRFGRFCCASLRFIVIKYTDTRRSPQDATYRARAESSKEGPATRGV